MKKRLLSLMLSFLLIFSMDLPVFAEDTTGTDPAPVKDSYEFDGVKYVNVGDENFASSQEDYYRSMLTNPVGKLYESDEKARYSLTDYWSILALEMMTHNDADALRNNIFKCEEYFESSELRRDISEPYGNGSVSGSIGVRESFDDGLFGGVKDIDFVYFKDLLASASTSASFAKGVAKHAVFRMCDSDGKDMNLGGDLPVTVNSEKAPELNGPVYYSLIGASGKDLHLYNQSPYNGNHFHGVVVAFSDFSITPIIPDENDQAPYAYVSTSVGTPSQDEQKIVSDVKNYSGETITASQNVSESTSSTVTSTINGSASSSTTDGYSISDTVKVGAKFTLEKVFEVSEEVSSTTTTSHSVTDTVSKGWSKSEGTTESTSESRTISISLPPYTTALLSQQHYNSETLVRYNCPAALNFKATIYYVYGKLTNNDSQVEISFEKLTDFGSTSDARSDLAKRYAQGTGASEMADADGIKWNILKQSYDSMIHVLSTTVPFDATPATFSGKINLVKTEVDEILPIYPIDAIKFVNPDGVLHNKPWLSEITMEKGDTNYAGDYNLRALNKFGADFYTFYKANGSYVFLDQDGNDITETGNDVIKPVKDPLSGQVKFTAVGEGTAYLRYKIKDGVYKTASMAASNTPKDFIDDSEIPHPAMLQINVKDTSHTHTWLKPKYTWSDDHTTCTAYRKCKYDDTHMMQETSDAESEETKAPTCTEDGIVTYTAKFDTDGFETQTATAKVAALGHNPGEAVKENEVAATCEKEGGYDEAVYCQTCKKEISRDHKTVPALGHNPGEAVKENEVAATCEKEGGYDEVVYCQTCKKEVSRDHKTIKALGHKWSDWQVIKEATEKEEGQEKRTCQNDPTHVETRSIPVLEHVHKLVKTDKKNATCSETGNIEYYTCSGCEKLFSDEAGKNEITQEDTVLAKKDHTPQVIKGKEATCTEPGLTDGSVCSVCKEVLKKQEEIAAKGHQNTEVRDAREASCKEEGYSGDTYCKDCGEKIAEGKVIPKKNHTPVADKAVPATTTSTGLTEGSHCSVCGEIIVRQQVIPKLTNPEGDKGDVNDPESAAAVEKAIAKNKKDGDIKGSTFGLLQLRAKKVSKKAIRLAWTKVKGADGYIIYGNRCNTGGKKYPYKVLKVLKGNTWKKSGLKKGTYYKFMAVAYKKVNGSQKILASSKTIHVATSGGKVGNYKAVRVNKKAVKLKKGKTFRIKARQIAESRKRKVKKHRAVCFESSNSKIATISKKGIIKAKKKGSCFVYVYSQSGSFAKMKVTVK